MIFQSAASFIEFPSRIFPQSPNRTVNPKATRQKVANSNNYKFFISSCVGSTYETSGLEATENIIGYQGRLPNGREVGRAEAW